MDDHLKSFLFLAEIAYNSTIRITSNLERVNTLEKLANDAQCHIPKTFFDAMRKIDFRHFVIKFDDLMEHASKESGIPLELIVKDKIIAEEANSLIYAIKMIVPLDTKLKHFSNEIGYDALIYSLLGLKQKDDVCEIVSCNGYLPALIGFNCNSVTSFNLFPELHCLPESNLKLAGYPQ